MDTQKKIILASVIIGIIALALAILFNYGVIFCVNLFLANVFIGIFTGAMVACVTAGIIYLSAKFEHTRKLVLSLWKLYGHLTSCANVNDEYRQKGIERDRLIQIRSKIVYIHGKIIERCEDISLILLEGDVLTKDKRDEIIEILVEIEEQFFLLKFALEGEEDTEGIKYFIDAQKQNIVNSEHVSNIKELLLEITKKYPKYYTSFEDMLIYPYKKEMNQ